jgi:hypothetical protein
MELCLEDFFVSYPSQSDLNFQKKIGAKKEFYDLRSGPNERPPQFRGQLYKHQKMVMRYMDWYDELLIIDEPGTGKTCTIFAVMENWKRKRGHIKHCYILAKGKQNKRELIHQLICKCTNGYYETEHLKSAETQQAQTKRINKMLRDWYTIKTFKSFLNGVRRKYWYKNSDGEEVPNIDAIREAFSYSIFCFDEIHSLRPDPHLSEDKEQAQKDIHYDTLKTIFHTIVGSKKILTSATPMVNDEQELIDHVNLLLPPDRQMDKNKHRLVDMTLDELRPYFYGKIHYLRAIQNIVIPKYVGIQIPSASDAAIQYQFIIYPTIMSDFQLRAYRHYNKQESTKDAVRLNARQASNFVYPRNIADDPTDPNCPIGLIGSEGFNKYIKQEGDEYRATEEFREIISHVDNIYFYSCKFHEILTRLADPNRKKGIMFIYGMFHHGSGLIALTLCLEHALKFRRFNESTSIFETTYEQRSYCQTTTNKHMRKIRSEFRPARRYAFITQQTSDSKTSAIMEALNSYENMHGDYIEVFITSPVGRDSINVSNVLEIEIIDSDWNRSGTFQAEYRGIRATSHVDLYEERAAMYAKEGIKGDIPPIEVEVRRHAAIAEEQLDTEDFANVTMFAVSENKDRRIKKVERKCKQLSFSCWLDYERNVVRGEDFSAACDYDVCEYECYNEPPAGVDTSTFDILYVDELLEAIIPSLMVYFSNVSVAALPAIYKSLPQYHRKYIDLAIQKMIKDKVMIKDRFGMSGYLLEYRGIVYITREYPFKSDSITYQLNEYNSKLIMSKTLTTKEAGYILSERSQESVIGELANKTPKEYEDYINSLNTQNKVKLLEQAISNMASGKPESNLDKYILMKYESFYYKTKIPVTELLAIEGKSGAKPKPGRPKSKKAQEEEEANIKSGIHTKLKEQQLEQVKIDLIGDDVYFHNLYALDLATAAKYNATVSYLRGDGVVRIMDKDYSWRTGTIAEQVAYNRIIQKLIDIKFKTYREKYPYYGTIIGGVFRIVTSNKEQGETKGQFCGTIDTNDLALIAYELNIPAPEPTQEDKEMTLKAKRKALSGSFSNVEGFTDTKVDYIYRFWKSKKDNLCNMIRSFMEENEMIATRV